MTPAVITPRSVSVLPAKPAANAAVAAAARPQGAPSSDRLALSATAKATAPQKVVVIDGKEYEVREKKTQWETWEKVTTWGATGVGAFVGIWGGAFAALAVDFSGALNPASIAAFAVGMAVCAGIGYLSGRGASKVVGGVKSWFD